VFRCSQQTKPVQLLPQLPRHAKNGSLASYRPSCEQQRKNGFNPPKNCTDPKPKAIGVCLSDLDSNNRFKCLKKLLPPKRFTHLGLGNRGRLYASRGNRLVIRKLRRCGRARRKLRIAAIYNIESSVSVNRVF